MGKSERVKYGWSALAVAWILLAGVEAGAQAASQPAGQRAAESGGASVLMLSDLHFDPFRDPAKVPRLAAAKVAEWQAILNEPNSATQEVSYAAVQAACAGKALDSDHALLTASLNAAKSHAGIKFVTVSGDLLVHQFDCRYQATMKKADYAEFAEKTASYVVSRVEAEFADVPVYVALGNNDTSCGDYKMDGHDRFLAGTSGAVIGGLHGASVESNAARESYETGGYFSVTLPAPMRKTRLLVLDDLFFSRKYLTCGGKADTVVANEQMAWLGRELDDARTRGEKVWVMAHIPPGFDLYSTVRKGDVCGGSKPEVFLSAVSDGALVDVLGAHDDVVKLAIFGHTHMDEMRLLPGKAGGVPAKGVGSVSPVDGNRPSFTVARLDVASGGIEDYAVYMAPNKAGTGGPWAQEYSFKETYQKAAYSAATLAEIVRGFQADPSGAAKASTSYEEFFDAKFPISPLVLAWPLYACGIDHYSEAGLKSCACAGK